MSTFQEIRSSNLLKHAEPLETGGSTCNSWCLEVNGRKQFLKQLKAELTDNPLYVSLFTKEFTVGEALNHPNLVKYNEMESSYEGVSMLLDYVAGSTIEEMLASDPDFFLDSRNLKRMVLQLLGCLAYLHSRQIVHCDLTTSNVMLTQVDRSVKVLDLGFCYTDCYDMLTGKTDGFAAPEQMADSTDGIDERTDLFAVGKILERIELLAFAPAGKSLPAKISTLKAACLHKDKQSRPRSADACITMLAPPTSKRIAIAAVAAVLALVAFMTFNSSARNIIRYTAKNLHFKEYDIADNFGNRYRILSEKDATCEAISYKRINDQAGPNLILDTEVSYFGKKYKVVSIAPRAYSFDTLIRSVFIPEGIETIGEGAFKNCNYITSLTLPKSLKTLGEDCFSRDSLLERVVIQDGLKILDNNMFVCCYALKDMILPEGIEVIDKDCFVSCTSLKFVHLPSTLREISRGVFFNCTSLKEITIPASVETIGDYAFFFCESLTDVYNLAPNPQVVAFIFNQKNLTIHVPPESVAAYRATPPWNNYDIVPISPAL